MKNNYSASLSRWIDLLLVVSLALLLALSAVFSCPVPIDLILGSLFVFFLPGYALLAALFPRQEPFAHDQRFILAVLLSLSLAPMTGYLMLKTAFGFSLESWKLAMTAITLLASGLAAWSRRRLPVEEIAILPFLRLEKWSAGLPAARLLAAGSPFASASWKKALPAVAASTALLLVGVILVTVLTFKPHTTYTEFYLREVPTPTQTLLSTKQESSPSPSLELWVVNHEQQPMVYILRQQLAGEVEETLATISLSDGESQSFTTRLSSDPDGARQISFRLYVKDRSQPYRLLEWEN